MANLGMTVVKLTNEETAAYEQIMAEAQLPLQNAAQQLYEDSSPKSVKELRNLYRRLPWAVVDKDAVAALERLRDIETTVIGAYIRMGAELAFAFHGGHKQNGVDEEEFLLEARMAIWDAIYTYTGVQKFSTYVYWCIKNRLITFTRSVLLHSGVNHRQVGEHTIYRLHEIKDVPASEPAEESEETQQMRQILAETELTPLERGLVEAHLNQDREYRSRLCETTNPTTGDPYTRQALSQTFLKACKKLKRNYLAKVA